MKKVMIWLNETTNPITYSDVDNTYVKGGFYCLHTTERISIKYPMRNIWRVVEDHSDLEKVLKNQEG